MFPVIRDFYEIQEVITQPKTLVVVDIDETLIGYEKGKNFLYDPELPDLFQMVKSEGNPIVALTARIGTIENQLRTHDHLREVGLHHLIDRYIFSWDYRKGMCLKRFLEKNPQFDLYQKVFVDDREYNVSDVWEQYPASRCYIIDVERRNPIDLDEYL